MKKFFKNIAASLVAAMLATGMTGVATSAAEYAGDSISVAVESADSNASYSYSFSDVGQSGRLLASPIITIVNPTYIDIYFGAVSSGSQALVTVVNSSNPNDTYGNFIMPTYAGATLHTSIYLPRGSFCFFVTPYNGTSTSGSFTASVR